jgi:light-regulated signal transduction histidine kinase (bacteriophytochrome)
MGQLIDDLLKLSRLTRAEMRFEPVDLSVTARAIAGDLQRTAPHRSVSFGIEPGVIARGDPRLLRVLLENLIGNAWKYTSRHPTARIEFGCTAVDGETAYYVRDDGAGFDPAYADKLFRPFQRLHTLEEFEGAGVGLATVQRVVRRHGGRIWADAAPEQGATFYFTLGGAAEEGDGAGTHLATAA